MEITELLAKIKEKKELSGLSNKIVEEVLNEVLKKNRVLLPSLKPSDIKIILKETRAELRKYSGRFQKEVAKRGLFLEKKDYFSLLSTHTSTKERLEIYPEITALIDKLGVKSILDLGCGLNPLALAKSNIAYYASDIREDELSLIKKFFEQNKINGNVFYYDLRKIDDSLPSADLCIIFKVFDIIEKKGHKLAEQILKKVNCRYFLVSFSTTKISGRRMNKPKRWWFEKMIFRLGYSYEVIEKSNEIFYIVKKN